MERVTEHPAFEGLGRLPCVLPTRPLPSRCPGARHGSFGSRARRHRRTQQCRALLELAAAGSASAAAVDALHAASVGAYGALPQLWLDLAASAAGAAGPGSIAQHASAAGAGTLPQLWYSLAEAAAAAPSAPPRDDGWLTPIAQGLDWLLLWFQAQLNAAHVPYASGWAIVCLTLVTKTLTFPFTKIQVESALATQNLKPTIDAIKRLYGDDKDKVQRETSALYKKSGVSPTAGCLPTLATIPVFWGLYRTLSNASSDGALTGGFYWLPDLAGPTSLAAQKAGAGIGWLYPLLDGAPPVGWEMAARYLVLPALLVGAQYASSAIISPPVNPDDDSAKTTKALLAFLPLMVGYFALNVPSGLSLYYFANTVITSGQQIWLRKLGGASAFEWQEEIGVNQARRTGPLAEPVLALRSAAAPATLSAPAEAPDISPGALPPLEPALAVPAASGRGLAHDGVTPGGGSVTPAGGSGAEVAAAASAGTGLVHGGAALEGGNGAAAAAVSKTLNPSPAGEAAAELARRCKRRKKDREQHKVLQGAAG